MARSTSHLGPPPAPAGPAPEPGSGRANGGRRQTAVQRIYDGMRTRIVDLSLPPGALIAKQEVAAEFGVSPTPVREAILRLEEEGLVEVFPQSRTVVSLIDVQHAREAHFLRVSAEVEIAKRLCGELTPDQLTELRALVERQAAALTADDLGTFTADDNRFHARIYEFAGVAGLWDLIRTRRAHIDRLRRLHLPEPGKASAILEEHHGLIDALAGNDPGVAERAVRDHLKGTLAASEDIRTRYAQYFH